MRHTSTVSTALQACNTCNVLRYRTFGLTVRLATLTVEARCVLVTRTVGLEVQSPHHLLRRVSEALLDRTARQRVLSGARSSRLESTLQIPCRVCPLPTAKFPQHRTGPTVRGSGQAGGLLERKAGLARSRQVRNE